MGWHDGLRLFAGIQVRSEPDCALATVIGNPQCQRIAGMVVPDLHGIDAMPV